MKSSRAVAMALSVICLLAAPSVFAGKDKEKDSGSEKKAPPPKQSTPAPAPAPHSGPANHPGPSSTSSTSSTSSQSNGSHPGSTHTTSATGEGNSSQSNGSHSGSSHGTSATGEGGSSQSNGSHSGSYHGTSATGEGGSSSSNGSHSGSHATSATGESTSEHGAQRSGEGTHLHNGQGTSTSESSHPGSHGPSNRDANSHNFNQVHPSLDSHGRYARMDHETMRNAMHTSPGQHEREHAFERSRGERTQFRRTVGAIRFVPAHRVILTNIRIVPTTYYYRRTVFYDSYGWAPSAYVYGLYPRYGLWDATFLAFALDHVDEEQYALMLYHHQHDAEIQQWMDDTDHLAADNSDLREKLDAMKAQMAKLDDSGLAADPAYVPPDAQDVALSPEVITQLTSK